MLFCDKCKLSFCGDDADLYPDQRGKMGESLSSTRCPACRVIGKMKWKGKEYKRINAKFDYFFQCYRKANGTPISTIDGGFHFPCPKCAGPAIETHVTYTHEHYKCKDCDHEFKVN